MAETSIVGLTGRETGGVAHRFTVQVTAESHFSWLRTRFSIERTAMSWVRTDVSLIGFGFAIVQFFDHFGSMRGVAPEVFPEAPLYLGLALIAAGLMAQVIALWQYRLIVDYLWSEEFRAVATLKKAPIVTPVTAVSVALILIGASAFVAIVARAL